MERKVRRTRVDSAICVGFCIPFAHTKIAAAALRVERNMSASGKILQFQECIS
jgi:hypothetical protein